MAMVAVDQPIRWVGTSRGPKGRKMNTPIGEGDWEMIHHSVKLFIAPGEVQNGLESACRSVWIGCWRAKYSHIL